MSFTLSISKAVIRPISTRSYANQALQYWFDYATTTTASTTTSGKSPSTNTNVLLNQFALSNKTSILPTTTYSSNIPSSKIMSPQLQLLLWMLRPTNPTLYYYHQEEGHLLEEVVDDEEDDALENTNNTDYALWLSSTLKKRRAKMNKHKLKKRRKKLRRKSKAKKN